MAGLRRIRVTLTLGPADTGSVELFRWVLAYIVDMHASAPVPMRVRVEVLPPGDDHDAR
jgi:hypothetical protein